MTFSKRIFIGLFFVLAAAVTAEAQVGVHIGINVPVFPRLVVVPGYPVYYAPDVRGNYFFYDGLYWVFNVDDGYWYSSSWYNGPWVFVDPNSVPQPLLVVPYRYYRVRPRYWSGWALDRPPRWGAYWGPQWEERHRDWDRWDRKASHRPAPLPTYQRKYEGKRYPNAEEHVRIHNDQYKYRPQDDRVREEHSKIIERESRGGEKASGRAEYIEKNRGGQDKGNSGQQKGSREERPGKGRD
jgi:hypothetical protein